MILAYVLESFDIQSINVIGLNGQRFSRLPSTTPHYSNEMKNISTSILHVSYSNEMKNISILILHVSNNLSI
jgi:hypothetical protein